MTPGPPLHFVKVRQFLNPAIAACGVKGPVRWTVIRRRVTCKNCRRVPGFQEP